MNALFLLLALVAADPPRTLVPAEILSVHDADTFTANILLPWDVTLRYQDIRVQGFDAWEVTYQRQTVIITADEIKKGIQARDATRKLFADAQQVYLEPLRPGDRRDPHGRTNAYVWVYTKDGKLIDFGQWLTDNGFIRHDPK